MPEGLYNPIAVSKGVITGSYLVNKYGRNGDVDAAEDIWNGGGDYTGFPTGAAETVQVFSSSAADAAAGTGARTVLIEGLDASYNLQSETITLNGVTPVVSINSYLRVFGLVVKTAGSGTTNAGTLTVRHSATTANIFLFVPVGYGQDVTCAYTIPAGYKGYIINYSAACSDAGATRIELAFKVRELGMAVRLLRPFVITAGVTTNIPIFGAVVLPEKTDVIVRALSTSSANAVVSAAFDLLVAVI